MVFESGAVLGGKRSMDKTALTWISAVTDIDKGKVSQVTKYPIDMSAQSVYLPSESLWIDWARG
jgi:hypothetical protein